MSKLNELSASQKLILLGHALETFSTMLIMIGTLLDKASDLPGVPLSSNHYYEIKNGSKPLHPNYWEN